MLDNTSIQIFALALAPVLASYIRGKFVNSVVSASESREEATISKAINFSWESDDDTTSRHGEPDCDEILSDLAGLRYNELQRFCNCGPDAPFSYLCVTRDEWASSFAEGTGCKGAMLRKIRAFHNANVASKRLTFPQKAMPVCSNAKREFSYDEIIRALFKVHYCELQQFCTTGVVRYPYNGLCLEDSNWKSSFGKGFDCKTVMINSISKHHRENAKSTTFKKHSGCTESGVVIDYDRILDSLSGIHYTALQRFCKMGRADLPFSELCLSEGEWNGCFAQGYGCKAAMISNILQIHRSNEPTWQA